MLHHFELSVVDKADLQYIKFLLFTVNYLPYRIYVNVCDQHGRDGGNSHHTVAKTLLSTHTNVVGVTTASILHSNNISFAVYVGKQFMKKEKNDLFENG